VKPISVKEAAEALGCSTRSVQYKLQNGDLKGIQQKNQYGVKEWRVWPTKEISEKLSAKRGQAAMNFAPDEKSVEAQEVFVEDEETEPTDWQALEQERVDLDRGRVEMMVQALVKPLTERIEAQAVALRDQEHLIEDQKRQLRLLPDLQNQAEQERKAAELKALESEALRKQIEAMQSAHEQAEEARRVAEAEIQRLNDEKDAQVAAVQEQVQALAATVQELQKPKPTFWQKFWGAQP